MNKQQLDVEVAVECGVIPAILLDCIRRWIEHNENNNRNYHDGCYWTFNSKEAWAKEFPYLTKDQVRRALDKLRAVGFLKTANYNKADFDRTMWYALTPKAKQLLYRHLADLPNANGQHAQCKCANLHNGLGTDAQPIPSINTSLNTHIFAQPKRQSASKPFVPPTLEEVQAYAKSRNSSVDAKFFYEYFSTGHWVDSQGKHVKNWKQKMLTWERSNIGGKLQSQIQPRPQYQEIVGIEEAGVNLDSLTEL